MRRSRLVSVAETALDLAPRVRTVRRWLEAEGAPVAGDAYDPAALAGCIERAASAALAW